MRSGRVRIFWEKRLCGSFVRFFNFIVCLVIVKLKEFFYTFWLLDLYKIYDLQIFSPPPFIFLIVPFDAKKKKKSL